MLAVLLFNVTATTLFIHSHIIEGTEVVHSHPYNPSGTHSHTRVQIILLDNTPIHDALIVESVACNKPYSTEIATIEERYHSPIIEHISLHHSLRAPPAKA